MNLGVSYYDKHRSVSVDLLGRLNLVLDEDMYGYSPDFYFYNCSLKTLFPASVLSSKESYFGDRLVLPYKFYTNYYKFIISFYKLNFFFRSLVLFFINPFFNLDKSVIDFAFIYRVFRMSIKGKKQFIKKDKYKKFFKEYDQKFFRWFAGKYYKKCYQKRKFYYKKNYFVKIKHSFKYIRFYNKRLKLWSQQFRSRIFFKFAVFSSNSSQKGIISSIDFKTLSFKVMSYKFFYSFFSGNRAFFVFQFVVPIIKRFIVFLYKIKPKIKQVEFFGFYRKFKDSIFKRFIGLLRKSFGYFSFRFKKILRLMASFSFVVSPYLVFLYSVFSFVLPFLFSFVIFVSTSFYFSKFSEFNNFKFNFFIPSYVFVFNWLRFNNCLNVFSLNKFSIAFKRFFINPIFFSVSFSRFNQFRYVFYPVFLFLGVFNNSLIFKRGFINFFEDYSFFYKFFFNILSKSTSLFFISTFFVHDLDKFFGSINLPDFAISWWLDRFKFEYLFSVTCEPMYFPVSIDSLFSRLFSRYFVQNIEMYNIIHRKIDFRFRHKSKKKFYIFDFYFC